MSSKNQYLFEIFILPSIKFGKCTKIFLKPLEFLMKMVYNYIATTKENVLSPAEESLRLVRADAGVALSAFTSMRR